MAEREFHITIGPDGTVSVEVKGYKGKACLEAAKIFEAAVGKLQDRRETSEYYEPEEQVHQHGHRSSS